MRFSFSYYYIIIIKYDFYIKTVIFKKKRKERKISERNWGKKVDVVQGKVLGN